MEWSVKQWMMLSSILMLKRSFVQSMNKSQALDFIHCSVMQ